MTEIDIAYVIGISILSVIIPHLEKCLFFLLFLKINHLKAGAQVFVFVFEIKFFQDDIIQFCLSFMDLEI